jgi:hypothetical protein
MRSTFLPEDSIFLNPNRRQHLLSSFEGEGEGDVDRLLAKEFTDDDLADFVDELFYQDLILDTEEEREKNKQVLGRLFKELWRRGCLRTYFQESRWFQESE